jgi:dipeptidyl aminopeptidase/acylaminoacyl peptidase
MPRRLLLLLLIAAPVALAAQGARPLTFLDQQRLRQAGAGALSPDGAWYAYALTTPDWTEAKSQSDLFLVATDRGVPSTRQLTFTRDKNETQPAWLPDGAALVFASNRDTPNNGTANQLYLLRLDGGEARRLTDVRDGVGAFAVSPDGRWLAYTGGTTAARQVLTLPVSGLDTASAVALTKTPSSVTWWRFSKDGRTLWYLAPDTVDALERQRTEKGFTVRIRNPVTPRVHLHAVDVATRATRRVTSDSAYSVADVTLSDDGAWVAFRGQVDDRRMRGTLEGNIWSDLYLLEVASGRIERLTTNEEINESAVRFSPDSRWLAFAAPNDFTYNRDTRVFLRPVDGGPLRELGDGYDGDVSIGWWSEDGATIHFVDGVKATTQLMALDVASGRVRQVTDVRGTLSAQRDEVSGRLLVSYADPATNPGTYAVGSVAAIADRTQWVRLTDPNPWLRDRALGRVEEITWTSTDGRPVGGVLAYPVGHEPGRRYPLIVAIHGGPQSADLLSFNGGYGSQVYAGAGYVVLMPNYRGSTNYGERHRTEVRGDYFKLGYADIMSGVDHLVARGIVDPARMGVLGWSAGGHYANWILTHTDRFKAISSGAGTMNWVSMYGQSDTQRIRQWFLGGKYPWEDIPNYMRQSPITYIRNARTPTMIHVVDGDPRVPRPQSEELHMALKKLGVPTEFYVYPGASHGIPDARNQYFKSQAEFLWMERYVMGKDVAWSWKTFLDTLGGGTGTPAVTSSP